MNFERKFQPRKMKGDKDSSYVTNSFIIYFFIPTMIYRHKIV